MCMSFNHILLGHLIILTDLDLSKCNKAASTLEAALCYCYDCMFAKNYLTSLRVPQPAVLLHDSLVKSFHFAMATREPVPSLLLT